MRQKLPDPWEAVQVMRGCLEAIGRTWTMDPCSGSSYIRLPIRLRHQIHEALNAVPPPMASVRLINGEPVRILDDGDTERLRDAVTALIDGSFEFHPRASWLVRDEHMRALRAALARLRLEDMA